MGFWSAGLWISVLMLSIASTYVPAECKTGKSASNNEPNSKHHMTKIGSYFGGLGLLNTRGMAAGSTDKHV